MADEDLDRTGLGAFLDAGAELVALGRRVQTVEHLAQRGTDDVLRNLGAIFGPVGFEHADLRRIDAQDEAELDPEVAHFGPQLFGRFLDHQPTLRARTFNVHTSLRGQHFTRLARARRCCALGVVGREGGRPLAAGIGHGIAIIAIGHGQIGRHFQRRRLGRALVVDLFGFDHAAIAPSQHQAGGEHGESRGVTSLHRDEYLSD